MWAYSIRQLSICISVGQPNGFHFLGTEARCIIHEVFGSWAVLEGWGGSWFFSTVEVCQVAYFQENILQRSYWQTIWVNLKFFQYFVEFIEEWFKLGWVVQWDLHDNFTSIFGGFLGTGTQLF